MDLVSTHREQINPHLFRADAEFAVRLNRIHMKQRVRILRLDDLRRFLDRFNRTNLVVHHHDGHQHRIFPHCIPQFLQRNNTVMIHRQFRDLIAEFF